VAVLYEVVEVRGMRSIEGDNAVVDVWMRYSVPQMRMKGLEACCTGSLAPHRRRLAPCVAPKCHVLGCETLIFVVCAQHA
jgi:hypothetical protein